MKVFGKERTGNMNYTQRGVRAKQQALNSKSGKFGRKLILNTTIIILIAVLMIGVWGASAAFGMYKGILESTPRISSDQVAPVGAATFIYDSQGNKMDELVAVNSNRIFVTMDKIPDYMGYAIVAIEDERFFDHNGIDFMGILRAGYQFIKTMGEETQGASTITQQLLKNTIFTDWTSEGDNMVKKIKRKIQEQYLAVELTKILTKDEILERYMNTINTGQNTLGVEAAAQRYFGKSVSDLSISECATIAVITQNPSKYNPISHPDKNAERRENCLNKMRDLGFITEAQHAEAMADDVYDRIERHNINYLENKTTSSYFTDAVTYDVKEDLLAAGYSETNVEFLLYSGGLRIITTLNPEIQAIVDEEVNDPSNYPDDPQWELSYALTVYKPDGTHQNFSKEMMTKYFKENVDAKFDLLFPSQEAALQAVEDYKAAVMGPGDEFDEKVSITIQPQISVVIMDQQTGEVVAMSGGRGVKEGRLTFNRATEAYRGPGSTFKVLAAYAPAIDGAGMTLATAFNDAPFQYDDGTLVKNWYKTGYKGMCRIRYGIEQSLNIVTVKCLTQISPRLGYDYLKNFGFEKITDHYVKNGQVFNDALQPLALGGVTVGVSNEELTAAYAAIANNGTYIEPKLYSKVLDSEGNVILDNTQHKSHQVLKESTAFLLTNAMKDVVTKGTGSSVNFNGSMDIVGKTGTTTDDFDVWFAGFTPYYTCATWAGYDTQTKMDSDGNDKETAIARTLWRGIMERVHENLPAERFEQPEDVVQVNICSISGKLPTPGVCDPHVMREYFAEGTEPTEICDVHFYGMVCNYERVMACAECPFAVMDRTDLTPIEDESLHFGASIPIEQPDGTIIYNQPRLTNYCQHDALWLTQPNATDLYMQQAAEIEARNAAAIAAAEAAAAAAAQAAQ